MEELNSITEAIIGASIAVHRALGPGLLESTYEACLKHELLKRGFNVERQKALPVIYDGIKLDCGYQIDLLVNGKFLVELKAGEILAKIHEAQVLSYLKLSGCRVGLLINFNVLVLKDGVRRLVNNYPG